MQNKSVFGEIALRLSSHPENIATEALLYLLNQYPSARDTLRRFVKQAGVHLDEGMQFRTQATSEDGSIPDLVGVDSDGDRTFVLEAKFWAGLTPNQPGAYLESLPKNKKSIVLVVAPGIRINMLWQKLRSAGESNGIQFGEDVDVVSEFRVTSGEQNCFLGICSWRSILSAIISDAEIASDSQLVSDASQLFGLCATMDGQAFFPLSETDLAPMIGKRMVQYADLVDDAVSLLTQNHGASTKGLTVGGHKCAYGRYLRMGELQMFLSSDPMRWGRDSESPIWLKFWEESETRINQLSDSIRSDLMGKDSSVFLEGQNCWVPIQLPLHCERLDVLDSIVEQVVSLANVCQSSSPIKADVD
ncbi:hypothetical protein N9B44_00040 [bacterium]|nr:hypothetical protein [bacterium]